VETPASKKKKKKKLVETSKAEEAQGRQESRRLKNKFKEGVQGILFPLCC
jgi:hypothetical protein